MRTLRSTVTRRFGAIIKRINIDRPARDKDSFRSKKIDTKWLREAAKQLPKVDKFRPIRGLPSISRNNKLYKPDTIRPDTYGMLMPNDNHVAAFICFGQTVYVLDPYTDRKKYTWPFKALNVPPQTPDGCGIHALLNSLAIGVALQRHGADNTNRRLGPIVADAIDRRMALTAYEKLAELQRKTQ